jgi:hypothetical protein
LIEHFNRHRASDFDNLNPLKVTTADFSRLYTNIPLDDLNTRITDFVKQYFQHNLHRGTHVKVSWAADLDPVWVKESDVPPSRFVYTYHKGNRRRQLTAVYFDLPTFTELFSWLLNNTFFTFGGRVFKQNKGIIMGSNVAVLLANLYLFMYEFDFIKQPAFLKPLPESPNYPVLLKGWTWARIIFILYLHTGRYLDDLFSLGNKLLPKLLYLTNTWELIPGVLVIRGIYPNTLEVTPVEATHGADHVNHVLDLKLHVTYDPHTPHSQHIDTSHYDKREWDLRMLPPKAFVHVDSDAPLWCLRNILFTRFLSIIKLTTTNRFHDCTAACKQVYVQMIKAGHTAQGLWPYLSKAADAASHHFKAHKRFILGCWIDAIADDHLSQVAGTSGFFGFSTFS